MPFEPNRFVRQGVRAKEQEQQIANEVCDYVVASSESYSASPYVVGIGGATSTGKTTLSQMLREILERRRKKVLIIGWDEFMWPMAYRREHFGPHWDDRHMRYDDAARFIDSFLRIKSGESAERIILRDKWDKEQKPAVLVKDDPVDLDGVDIVIFEGIYALSDEPRLGDFQRIVDLPVYLQAEIEHIGRWKAQKEAEEQLRPPEEWQAQWEKGDLPDLRNIIPSMLNAQVIIHLDGDHTMSREWTDRAALSRQKVWTLEAMVEKLTAFVGREESESVLDYQQKRLWTRYIFENATVPELLRALKRALHGMLGEEAVRNDPAVGGFVSFLLEKIKDALVGETGKREATVHLDRELFAVSPEELQLRGNTVRHIFEALNQELPEILTSAPPVEGKWIGTYRKINPAIAVWVDQPGRQDYPRKASLDQVLYEGQELIISRSIS